MTEEDLKAIEERANKATSGPWHWHQAPGFGADCFLRSRTDKTYSEYTYIASGISGFDNCEFIAHSREDIPKLIKALREARNAMATQNPIYVCSTCGFRGDVLVDYAKGTHHRPSDANFCNDTARPLHRRPDWMDSGRHG